MSAAVAQAEPSFVLVESQARAGDAVHFSITGAEDRVKYDLEVAGRDVLAGEADGDAGAISGQFTMPDLGGTAKSVTVEAEIEDDGDDETTVKRKLQYLGPAVQVDPAPAPPVALTVPATPQQTGSGTAPAQGPAAAAAPTAPAKAQRRAKRKRRQARKRRAAARRRDISSPSRSERTSERKSEQASRRAHRDAKEEAKAKAKGKRVKRPAARTAPLFDGVPEPESGGSSAGEASESEKARANLPAGVLTTAVANRNGDDQHATVILIPGLLGLAAFVLAGATLLRKRRTR